MSEGSLVRNPGFEELGEWLQYLGLLPAGEDTADTPVQEKLKDGILLCQLVNKIKPGSIEDIKPKRSSGDAEENILRFLQACTTLGIKKIFRPADLLDKGRNLSNVLVTLQLLYNRAADLGMGLRVRKKSPVLQTENGVSPGDSSGIDEEGEEDEVKLYARAVYAFNGTNDDELHFVKGDLITVTNIVDGGWWEGLCNGKVGWFPGSYVEEIPRDAGMGAVGGEEDAHHYYKLVIQDILESERSYFQDLNALLSNYLLPLRTTSVVSPKEVSQLTGNLPELTNWQRSFLQKIEDCSRLPVPQQTMGAVFMKCIQEMKSLYTTYCANHPKAVAVLTENSDKLSAFMESKGAVSPGMLTLTSNLSKPFRRLEKYVVLLKELQRQLIEGHSDADNVQASITAYKDVLASTQEIRKRKEMEHEMLSNPVKGFDGNCLNELGECKCVIPAHQALNSEEIDEVFFLVFPSSFIILAVGPSLSGYEIKNNFVLSAVSLKKSHHSEQWPWPVELQHNKEIIHASLSTEANQRQLIDAVLDRSEGVRTPTTPRAQHGVSAIMGSKGLSRADSAQIFRTAYPTRTTRQSSVNIQRPHHWGFKSIRPVPPLKTQELMALRERNRSPKAAKKFNYSNVKKKRGSKHMEELLAMATNLKVPVENKVGDNAILRVVEAYCMGGRGGGAIHSDKPVTYISRNPSFTGVRSHTFTAEPDDSDIDKKVAQTKSLTLPGNDRHKGSDSLKNFSRPPNPNLPGYPYRAPSPIYLADSGSDQQQSRRGQVAFSSGGKSVGSKRSLFRRRAESVDNSRNRHKV